jgi:hypothetical protein
VKAPLAALLPAAVFLATSSAAAPAPHAAPTRAACVAARPVPANAIARPRWIARPVKLERFYPEFRDLLRAGACAVLDCRATARGTLGHCSVIVERPAGSGVGRAAQVIARDFRMSSTDADGRPVAGRQVRIDQDFVASAAAAS